MAYAADVSERCERCRCAECLDQVMHCHSDGSVADPNCPLLLTCGEQNHCVDEECTCGSDESCRNPGGPCAGILLDAAHAARLTPSECNRTSTCAGYQAYQIGLCVVANCSQDCT